jgi:hypothetical protein
MSIVPTRGSRSPRRRPGARRLAVVAALALGLALLGSACKQLDPDNRAASVPGVTNGNLPMSYLASNGKGCTTYDEAMPSMQAMIAQAAVDGVVLRPTSCYRDYAGQVAARNDWCNRGACNMAAVPGTSNHGWGKAVDFADQSGSLGFDSAGYTWMKTWAGYFGWMHPKTMEADGPVPEAWHWEWVGDGGKMYPGEYFGTGNTPPSVPRGQPFGNLDAAVPTEGGIAVAGWAIDPDQAASIPVRVLVDDQVSTTTTADTARPDVGAVYPLYADSPHGFSTTVPATPGAHQVCAYAVNVSGTGSDALVGCRTVTVAGPEPTSPGTPSSLSAAAVGPTTTEAAPSTTVAPPPSSTTTSTTSTVMPSTTTSTTAAGPGASTPQG